jgi:hypothetical protein
MGQNKEKEKITQAKEKKKENLESKKQRILYSIEKSEVGLELRKKARALLEERTRIQSYEGNWSSIILLNEFLAKLWRKFEDRRERVMQEKRVIMTIRLLIIKHKRKMIKKHPNIKFRLFMDSKR